MIKNLLFICIMCISCKAQAQIENSAGSWTTLNGKISTNEKWSSYLEFQRRSLALYYRF